MGSSEQDSATRAEGAADEAKDAAKTAKQAAEPRTFWQRLTPSAEGIKTIGGLVAVVVAVVLVTGLAITAMVLIDNKKDAQTMIPLVSAAFGVISALVGAFLGMKIGTDQSKTFAQDAQEAHAKLGAVQNFVPEEKKEKAQKAAAEAAAAARTTSPPSGS